MKKLMPALLACCVAAYAGSALAGDDYWNADLYSSIEKKVKASEPSFPNATFKVLDKKYAGLVSDMYEEYFVSDGKDGHKKMTQKVQDYTLAIQTAIDDANKAGGGTVVVPAQQGATRDQPTVYYTGSLEIKSNVNLHLEEGVELRFVRNISNKYYPMVLTSFEGLDTYNYASPIRAFHAKNIALTGKGTLNPQADAYNWQGWKKGTFGFEKQSDVVDVLVKQWSDQAVPVERRLLTDGVTPVPERIPTMKVDFDNIEQVTYVDAPKDVKPLRSLLRPCTVETYACENVLIEGVRIINSPMWEVHPLRSRNIWVRNLEIDSHGHNNDGVNPESCQYVLIENSSFSTGDDCIAIKSGKNRDGYNRGKVGGEPCGNIIIRNNVFADGHGGVTMGSECTGGISNVFAHDNHFDSLELQQVLRFKTNSYRGGLIENIYFKDNTVATCSNALMYGETQYTLGSAQDKEGDLGPYTPQLRDVYMSNITAGKPDSPVKAKNAILWKAYERAPMTDINVRDVTVYGVKNAITLQNVKDFTLENVRISLEDTPADLVTYNTVEIDLDDVKLTAAGKDYELEEDETLTMPDGFDKQKDVVISGTLETEDSAFAEGKGTVNAFLDRGILEPGSKAPVIKPYPAEVKSLGNGKYSFTVSVPLTDKPDYQYAYRPDTEAENMKPGNHILSLVATGLTHDQNTWNYRVICK
ncbi:MAG: glycoside hydrolase family 28 protein [Succinivibrionaceae bacterium]|nr:glycoside hydrolase family 28 protein [Succinivibrionaceae bacterium]